MSQNAVNIGFSVNKSPVITFDVPNNGFPKTSTDLFFASTGLLEELKFIQ